MTAFEDLTDVYHARAFRDERYMICAWSWEVRFVTPTSDAPLQAGRAWTHRGARFAAGRRLRRYLRADRKAAA